MCIRDRICTDATTMAGYTLAMSRRRAVPESIARGADMFLFARNLEEDYGFMLQGIKDGIITRWDMTILPADFNSVLELTESLYRHATHILSFLPGTEISRRSNADRDALLQSMEREFTRSAFLLQAEATGIKPGTASTWLKRLVKHGMIESVDGKGTYRKPLPNGV